MLQTKLSNENILQEIKMKEKILFKFLNNDLAKIHMHRYQSNTGNSDKTVSTKILGFLFQSKVKPYTEKWRKGIS